MKSSKRFTRVAVLSGFIILLTTFVAYRSGAFDHYLNGDAGSNLIPDNSALTQQLPIIDSPPLTPAQLDSLQKKPAPVILPRRALADNMKRNDPRQEYMGGSKSAMIFTVRDSSHTVYRNSETGQEYILMSGSKSGAVIKIPVHRFPKNLKIPVIDDSVLRIKDTIPAKPIRPIRGTKSAPLIEPAALKNDTPRKSN